MFHFVLFEMSIERFYQYNWLHISHLVTMETHIPIVLLENGHKYENISGSQHTKVSENTEILKKKI